MVNKEEYEMQINHHNFFIPKIIIHSIQFELGAVLWFLYNLNN